ncbi:MAG: co-chaperone GroES [bacterium]|nr:co-chaperone GroES [bacterium]
MKAKHNIKPLFDNVLIKPLQKDEVTASGIFIPDTVKEKPQMGEVMAIGDGTSCSCDGKSCNTKMIVKVGQKVIYKKWGGNEVKVGNEEWLIVEQKDVMAIVA